MLIPIITFLIACFVLIKSSSSAVKSIAHIARAVHLTEFVTSFIVVALVSALPETLISVISALDGAPEIGIGTLLGSNIADLTLILGLVALVGGSIKIHSSIVRKDLWFVALTMLPILLAIDGMLTRIDAVILLASGITFIIILLRERAYFHKPYQDGNHAFKQLIIFILSITAMLTAAYFIVHSAEQLALGIGIPPLIIGLVLIALGTTLPEFSFSLQSVRRGHSSLAIGDLLGVVVVDATIITGITALITPVVISQSLVLMIGTFTAFAALAALIFMRTDQTVTKNEGLALVLFYIAFVAVQALVT